jgi:hypothetical protein
MGFVQRELDRIQILIADEALGSARFVELFAAQQALSWVLEPSGFASPYASITKTPDLSSLDSASDGRAGGAPTPPAATQL